MDFAFSFLVFSWVFISPKFSTKILDVPLDLLCESRFGVTLTRETLDLSLDFFLRSNHIKICSDKKTTSLLFSQLQLFFLSIDFVVPFIKIDPNQILY